MKKSTIISLVIAFSFIMPSVSQAVTIEELQVQINALMAQLAAMSGQQGEGFKPDGCYAFNVNLTVGSRGPDVIALQQMLITQGYLIMPEEGKATGYFGILTKAAVAKWQVDNGISPADGFFGPISRAKMNQLYGCGVKFLPFITVLSPNGGELWAKGTTQTIKWQDNSPVPLYMCAGILPCPERTYDLTLVPYYPPCTSNYCPKYPYHTPYTIANGVVGNSNDNNKYFKWLVGSGPGFDTVPDGQYNVQVCQSGTSVCDSSDSYFKIVSTPSGAVGYPVLIYPPSGAVWHPGDIATVTWAWKVDNSNAVPVNVLLLKNPYLSYPNYILGVNVAVQLVDGQQTLTWRIGKDINGIVVEPGSYNIQVCPADRSDDSHCSTIPITVSSPSPSQTVASSEIIGGQSTYNPGQTITFSVKGTASDGFPGAPTKGFNVQANMYSSDLSKGALQIGGVYQSFNADYDSNSGLWKIVMTAPSDTTETYKIETYFYCSNSSLGCSDGQINKSFTFRINSTTQSTTPLKVKRANPDTSFFTAQPTSAWVDSGTVPDTNNLSTFMVNPGQHTVYANQVPGYTIAGADLCFGVGCSTSAAYSNGVWPLIPTCDSTPRCSITLYVTQGQEAKVVFEYVPNTNLLRVKRVGSDLKTVVDFSTSASFDNNASDITNPADFMVSAGPHTVYTNTVPGYAVYAGVCYNSDGCVPSYLTNPTCDQTRCWLPVTVSSNFTKVVFEYLPQGVGVSNNSNSNLASVLISLINALKQMQILQAN